MQALVIKLSEIPGSIGLVLVDVFLWLVFFAYLSISQAFPSPFSVTSKLGSRFWYRDIDLLSSTDNSPNLSFHMYQLTLAGPVCTDSLI